MFIFQNSYFSFIVGIIVIDIGMQCADRVIKPVHCRRLPKATKPGEYHLYDDLFCGWLTGNFSGPVHSACLGWTGVVCVGIGLTLISHCFVTLLPKLIIQNERIYMKKNVIYLERLAGYSSVYDSLFFRYVFVEFTTNFCVVCHLEGIA